MLFSLRHNRALVLPRCDRAPAIGTARNPLQRLFGLARRFCGGRHRISTGMEVYEAYCVVALRLSIAGERFSFSKKANRASMNTETINTARKSPSKGALTASVSAVGSLLAAATCCLPVLPFVLAAGTAGTARFLSSFIGALRPYLLGLSVVFIGSGFYQSRRASQCNCKPSVLSQVVLWLSALIVVISILLPQAFADLVERLL